MVLFKKIKRSTRRMNFEFKQNYHREYVSGWEEEQKWNYTIQNDRNKAVKIELRQRWYGHVLYTSKSPVKLFDYRTIQSTWSVAKHTKHAEKITVTRKNGSKRKQNRIQLQK